VVKNPFLIQLPSPQAITGEGGIGFETDGPVIQARSRASLNPLSCALRKTNAGSCCWKGGEVKGSTLLISQVTKDRVAWIGVAPSAPLATSLRCTLGN